jgi:hypothetical protein
MIGRIDILYGYSEKKIRKGLVSANYSFFPLLCLSVCKGRIIRLYGRDLMDFNGFCIWIAVRGYWEEFSCWFMVDKWVKRVNENCPNKIATSASIRRGGQNEK